MKRSRIRRVSKKMIAQKKEEIRIRIALAERCGGRFIFESTLTGGFCSGGRCELCGKRPDWRNLTPHEDPKRSQGGKLSMDSKMICGKCHSATEGIKEVRYE